MSTGCHARQQYGGAINRIGNRVEPPGIRPEHVTKVTAGFSELSRNRTSLIRKSAVWVDVHYNQRGDTYGHKLITAL